MTTITLTLEQAKALLDALDTGLDAAMQVANEYHQAMKGYHPYRHKAVDDDCAQISSAITVLGQLIEDATDGVSASDPDRAEKWRQAALAFERRAMRVEAALRAALTELSDQSRSGYVARAMDVLRAESADGVAPSDDAKALADAMNEIDRLNRLLTAIGDYAHDRSTGPAVPDALWEVRRMAYESESAAGVDLPDGGTAAMTEIELIEKAAVKVGMTSLLNHGAASCVYSEGCNGVTQAHLVAFAREVALHCVAALGVEACDGGQK